MKFFSLLLLLLLLLPAACATAERPHAPVRDVRYSALGERPFWLVTIGDRRIVFSFPAGTGDRPAGVDSHSYPRVLPARLADGTKRWESSDGTAAIAIEARRGPCSASGIDYADRVTVSLNGIRLQGCGGRRLSGARGR